MARAIQVPASFIQWCQGLNLPLALAHAGSIEALATRFVFENRTLGELAQGTAMRVKGEPAIPELIKEFETAFGLTAAQVQDPREIPRAYPIRELLRMTEEDLYKRWPEAKQWTDKFTDLGHKLSDLYLHNKATDAVTRRRVALAYAYYLARSLPWDPPRDHLTDLPRRWTARLRKTVPVHLEVYLQDVASCQKLVETELQFLGRGHPELFQSWAEQIYALGQKVIKDNAELRVLDPDGPFPSVDDLEEVRQARIVGLVRTHYAIPPRDDHEPDYHEARRKYADALVPKVAALSPKGQHTLHAMMRHMDAQIAAKKGPAEDEDLDYFRQKLYAALQIPKEHLPPTSTAVQEPPQDIPTITISYKGHPWLQAEPRKAFLVQLRDTVAQTSRAAQELAKAKESGDSSEIARTHDAYLNWCVALRRLIAQCQTFLVEAKTMLMPPNTVRYIQDEVLKLRPEIQATVGFPKLLLSTPDPPHPWLDAAKRTAFMNHMRASVVNMVSSNREVGLANESGDAKRIDTAYDQYEYRRRELIQTVGRFKTLDQEARAQYLDLISGVVASFRSDILLLRPEIETLVGPVFADLDAPSSPVPQKEPQGDTPKEASHPWTDARMRPAFLAQIHEQGLAAEASLAKCRETRETGTLGDIDMAHHAFCADLKEFGETVDHFQALDASAEELGLLDDAARAASTHVGERFRDLIETARQKKRVEMARISSKDRAFVNVLSAGEETDIRKWVMELPLPWLLYRRREAGTLNALLIEILSPWPEFKIYGKEPAFSVGVLTWFEKLLRERHGLFAVPPSQWSNSLAPPEVDAWIRAQAPVQLRDALVEGVLAFPPPKEGSDLAWTPATEGYIYLAAMDRAGYWSDPPIEAGLKYERQEKGYAPSVYVRDLRHTEYIPAVKVRDWIRDHDLGDLLLTMLSYGTPTRMEVGLTSRLNLPGPLKLPPGETLLQYLRERLKTEDPFANLGDPLPMAIARAVQDTPHLRAGPAEDVARDLLKDFLPPPEGQELRVRQVALALTRRAHPGPTLLEAKFEGVLRKVPFVELLRALRTLREHHLQDLVAALYPTDPPPVEYLRETYLTELGRRVPEGEGVFAWKPSPELRAFVGRTVTHGAFVRAPQITLHAVLKHLLEEDPTRSGPVWNSRITAYYQLRAADDPLLFWIENATDVEILELLEPDDSWEDVAAKVGVVLGDPEMHPQVERVRQAIIQRVPQGLDILRGLYDDHPAMQHLRKYGQNLAIAVAYAGGPEKLVDHLLIECVPEDRGNGSLDAKKIYLHLLYEVTTRAKGLIAHQGATSTLPYALWDWVLSMQPLELYVHMLRNQDPRKFTEAVLIACREAVTEESLRVYTPAMSDLLDRMLGMSPGAAFDVLELALPPDLEFAVYGPTDAQWLILAERYGSEALAQALMIWFTGMATAEPSESLLIHVLRRSLHASGLPKQSVFIGVEGLTSPKEEDWKKLESLYGFPVAREPQNIAESPSDFVNDALTDTEGDIFAMSKRLRDLLENASLVQLVHELHAGPWVDAWGMCGLSDEEADALLVKRIPLGLNFVELSLGEVTRLRLDETFKSWEKHTGPIDLEPAARYVAGEAVSPAAYESYLARVIFEMLTRLSEHPDQTLQTRVHWASRIDTPPREGKPTQTFQDTASVPVVPPYQSAWFRASADELADFAGDLTLSVLAAAMGPMGKMIRSLGRTSVGRGALQLFLGKILSEVVRSGLVERPEIRHLAVEMEQQGVARMLQPFLREIRGAVVTWLTRQAEVKGLPAPAPDLLREALREASKVPSES